MNSIDAPEPRHDLGVLFVHGIGQSKQGETLLNFGEPLRAAIEQLLEPAGQGFPVAAKVSAAWLSDPGSGVPARAELSIEGARRNSPDAGLPSKWLLAEAWWAETFPTPTYSDIASWTFGALPATLISHFDRRFRRAGFDLVRALRGDAALVRSLSALVRMVIEGLVLTLALATTPVLLLMVAALLVLGLPPFKATRDLAGSLQRTIAATVGDSFVFMHQAMTASAITTTVRERLEWLSARCRRVAVVAHSQGAAVAHRVLRNSTTAPCDVFVTFGSGLGKLSDIERGDIARGRGYLWLAAGAGVATMIGVVGLFLRGWNAGLGPFGLLLPALRIFLVVEAGALAVFVTMTLVAFSSQPDSRKAAPVPPGSPWISLLLWPSVFAAAVAGVSAFFSHSSQPGLSYWGFDETFSVLVAGGLALAFAAIAAWRTESLRSTDPKMQWLRDRELFASDYVMRNRNRMEWHDLYASADPVSNGRLLDEFDAPYLFPTQVFNEHSAPFDHTGYWKSTDDFVQRVAQLLLKQTSLHVRGLTSFRAAARRRWRVGVLAWSRRALALAALGVALCWASDIPPWISQSFRILRPKPKEDAGFWATWSHEWLQRLWPWLAAVAIAAAAWWLLKRAWTLWSEREIKSYWEAHDYAAVPGELCLVLALPVAGAVTAGSVAFGVPGGVSVTMLLLALAALSYWPWRSAYLLASRSGTGAMLDKLRTERLGRVLDAALRARDGVAVTTTANQLLDADVKQARDALHKAAFHMKSPNAALSLGRSLESEASASKDPTQTQRLRDEALAAFKQGATLGDPICAWFAAREFERRNDDQAAMAMFHQAYDNGDALSAYSIGSALMKSARTDPTKRDEARAFFEEGARRGDLFSARFLAQHCESLADNLEGDEEAQGRFVLSPRLRPGRRSLRRNRRTPPARTRRFPGGQAGAQPRDATPPIGRGDRTRASGAGRRAGHRRSPPRLSRGHLSRHERTRCERGAVGTRSAVGTPAARQGCGAALPGGAASAERRRANPCSGRSATGDSPLQTGSVEEPRRSGRLAARGCQGGTLGGG